MQERRLPIRIRRRGRKRIIVGVMALAFGAVYFAHSQLVALEEASIASLNANTSVQKIATRAARRAAGRSADAGGTAQAATPYVRARFGDSPATMTGPAPAGIAMQVNNHIGLPAGMRDTRFRRPDGVVPAVAGGIPATQLRSAR